MSGGTQILQRIFLAEGDIWDSFVIDTSSIN